MPIYDYECRECGYTEELMLRMDDNGLRGCPKCKRFAFRRLISAGAAPDINLANQSRTWLNNSNAVVDPDSRNPADVEFRRNPTRANRDRYMKANNLIEYEPGMRTKPDPTRMDTPEVTRKLAELAQKRRALSVRSR